MIQVPILNGVYTSEGLDFRVAYPRNLIPVPVQTGISNGYLKPVDGIVELGTGPGTGRGGINWQNILYRVMGDQLVRVFNDGSTQSLGSVGSGNLVKMDYSFDRLSISTNNALYYWDNATLQQVTDPDLGKVVDHIWVDGYFMVTDGEDIRVTELQDPTAVRPAVFGSSETDPDPVVALLKVRNEPHAINRYSIEALDNIGGDGFPFARIEGAYINRGAIGTSACCVFDNNIAFVGGGRNEPPSIWLGLNGNTQKISTREIDIQLRSFTEKRLSTVKIEAREDKGNRLLYVHLPNKTLVFDFTVSQEAGELVWHELSSSPSEFFSLYKARDFVYCYDKWNVVDPTSTKLGVIQEDVGSHWGVDVHWEFRTPIIYNQSLSGLVHEIELVGLTGRAQAGKDTRIYTSHSYDGVTYSLPRAVKGPRTGARTKKIAWLGQGTIKQWRIQKFFGQSDVDTSFARLEVDVEGLTV